MSAAQFLISGASRAVSREKLRRRRMSLVVNRCRFSRSKPSSRRRYYGWAPLLCSAPLSRIIGNTMAPCKCVPAQPWAARQFIARAEPGCPAVSAPCSRRTHPWVRRYSNTRQRRAEDRGADTVSNAARLAQRLSPSGDWEKRAEG